MRVIGVDGFKAGWVGVVLRHGRFETALLERTFRSLLEKGPDAAVVAVDIPIGSEPDRFRRVDATAKAFVGPRRASVFPMPPIDVFKQPSYERACARCRELTTKAPSKQVWELRSKILEVDEVAVPGDRIIEVHPEVSFRALAGLPLAHGKKTWTGHLMRRSALAKVGIEVPEALGPAGEASPDDVLDAAAAAWSAHRHGTASSENLDPRIVDCAGRDVTIWF